MMAAAAARVVKLPPQELTAEAFARYGQVVGPLDDGAEFGSQDAKLDLSQGTPRFYIMRLRDRPLSFDRITHHASVTQCLGCVGARSWYLGVAPPSIVTEAGGESRAAQQRRSSAGHSYLPPKVDDVEVFHIAGPAFVKLHPGTWHAGPLFGDGELDFYNLELSNTNVVDHTTHMFAEEDGILFEVERRINGPAPSEEPDSKCMPEEQPVQ
eukprot:SM000202S05862  [mRNA]  locus=s202:76213:77485:+ [translate_table: standard]